MMNFKKENQGMTQSTTVGAVHTHTHTRISVDKMKLRDNQGSHITHLNTHLSCAISLIALIITIIVIIILAAVVIGSSLSTPEQANFARFSSDFSEIESQVKTTYATEYGKVAMSNQNLTKSQIYQKLAGSATYSESTNSKLRCISFTNVDGKLGNTDISIPSYSQASDWSINCETGNIVYSPMFANNNKLYYTATNYLADTTNPSVSLDANNIATQNFTIIRGVYILTVPKGFGVATLDSDGVVTGLKNKAGIETLTASDIEHGIVVVDNSSYATANDFTWVPCSIDGKAGIKYSRYNFSNNQTVDVGDGPLKVGTITYTEDLTDAKTILAKASVEKYGGFYVGRYEAGKSDNAKTTTAPVLSQRDKFVYNYVTRAQAKTLSEGMYNDENLAVGSKLISDYEWDTILAWIESTTENDIRNSTAWGNYCDSAFTIKTAKGSIFPSFVQNPPTYGDKTSKARGANVQAGILFQTGIITADSANWDNRVNNMYDIAGNQYEWTTGTSDRAVSGTAFPCVARGGSFGYNGYISPVSIRSSFTESFGIYDSAFRPVLYIK